MKWLLISFLLLAAAFILKLGMLVFAGYAVLGLSITSWVMGRRASRGIRLERSAHVTQCEIGEKAQLSCTITNGGHTTIRWCVIQEYFRAALALAKPDRYRLHGKSMVVTRLKPGEQTRLEYEITFLRRGYYRCGPALVETGDLFGFEKNVTIAGAPCFITVLPKVIPISEYDIESRRPLGEIRLQHRLYEDRTRIAGIRAFQPGDSLNQIHWRASGHTGILQSKTFEPSCIAGATLLLDFSTASYPEPGRYYRSELAVTLAATLCEWIGEAGEQLALCSNAVDPSMAQDSISTGEAGGFRSHAAATSFLDRLDESAPKNAVFAATARGPAHQEIVMKTLARLELNKSNGLQQALAEVGGRLNRGATVIAILGDLSIETGIALGQLKRNGYAVVAAVMTTLEQRQKSWAELPEWALILTEHGIPFHEVADESAIRPFCSQWETA